MNEQELLTTMVTYLNNHVFEPQLRMLEAEHANFENYSANPFLLPYQSKIIENENNAQGAAKALYYSRVLSTSINTAFGSHIRRALETCNLCQSINSKSNTIIFTDSISRQRTGCILKSGPNTINSGDKRGIRNKLNDILEVEIRIIAVLYGMHNELNSTYLQLENEFDILVGNEFWHRITGYPHFYRKLQHAIRVHVANWDTGDNFQRGLRRLTVQIENNYPV